MYLGPVQRELLTFESKIKCPGLPNVSTGVALKIMGIKCFIG
jgi:hypothetical protein